MSFGEVLKIIRKRNGSLRAVAERLETDFAYLSRLENDKLGFTPSADFVNRIVERLDCTDAEKESLFSEARRFDRETEGAIDESHSRPQLRTLFRSAPRLSEEELQRLNKKINDLLEKSES
mgnify:CR=1 FL=1